MTDRLDFGLTAGERPWLGDLGARLDELGYGRLWANDNPGRSGLATLARAAADAPRLGLGLGVASLSEREPEEIAAELDALPALAARSLVVGVGSGGSRSLDLVAAGVARLRVLLPGHPIAVAAVGPRMCALAGRVADAAVLNWAGPARLRDQRRLVAHGAAGAARPVPPTVAYVRVALGSGAAERLRAEMTRYRGFGASYARALDEQGDDVVGVAGRDPAAVRAALEAYRGAADAVVVRGLPATDDLEGWLAIAEAAAGADWISGAS